MKSSSTYKTLYLLNLLSEKDLTKNDIINEFKNHGIKLNKATINEYIKKLIENDVAVEISHIKNKNLYSIRASYPFIEFSQKETEVINDVKKLLICQKNYHRIRKTMRLFYKIALFIKNKEQKEQFLDFGYYSTIDWFLVKQLEEHCASKDVILIDYVMSDGENKYLKIHTDRIKIGSFSNRLYLDCVLYNDTKMSHIPVDRIYMIKKVIEKNKKINLEKNFVIYKVLNETYKKATTDIKEKILKKDNKYTTVQRPIEDEFYLVQRLLYFCPDLFYISDEKLKKAVCEKLEMMKKSYETKDR